MASKLMKQNDSNPPTLYGRKVLNTANSQNNAKLRIDEDPIKALEFLKCNAHLNAIHNIGQSPFFVHYWTAEQKEVYKKIQKLYGASISLDATDFSIKKIHQSNKVHKAILLYLISTKCPEGQISKLLKLLIIIIL